MAWLYVRNNIGVISNGRPIRYNNEWQIPSCGTMFVYIPLSYIKKLIGRELTSNDEPVEL